MRHEANKASSAKAHSSGRAFEQFKEAINDEDFEDLLVEGVYRGTRHLQAAEPRRRGGRERRGVHRGTRHLPRLPFGYS